MATGHQKPEHGGNFFMVPRRVIESVAWRHLSLRARVVLQVFQFRHNGFNNGHIAIGIHEIGKLVGDQNHGANGKAVAELIEKGFLECMSDADRHHSKVREYRITFIPTGTGKNMRPADHEYRNWRPPVGHKRKFGGARTATKTSPVVVETATEGKFSGAVSASSSTEIGATSEGDAVAVSAPLISNQSPVHTGAKSVPIRSADGPAVAVDVGELRTWMCEVLELNGHGGQKRLSDESGVPQSVLCKFKNGRGLPSNYRIALQLACARHVPHSALGSEPRG